MDRLLKQAKWNYFTNLPIYDNVELQLKFGYAEEKMKIVQDLIDEYGDALSAIPGVANISPGPDGKSAFRVWVDDEKTRETLEKLLAKELEGFPVIVQIVCQGKLF